MGLDTLWQTGRVLEKVELHFLAVEVTLTCGDTESWVSTRTPRVQRIPRSALQNNGVKSSHPGGGILLDNVPTRREGGSNMTNFMRKHLPNDKLLLQ